MRHYIVRTVLRSFIVLARDADHAHLVANLAMQPGEDRREPRIGLATSFPHLVAAEDAFSSVTAELDCVDNYRFAYCDDAVAMAEYNDRADAGCCGSIDSMIVIGNRIAMMGCNYGH